MPIGVEFYARGGVKDVREEDVSQYLSALVLDPPLQTTICTHFNNYYSNCKSVCGLRLWGWVEIKSGSSIKHVS